MLKTTDPGMRSGGRILVDQLLIHGADTAKTVRIVMQTFRQKLVEGEINPEGWCALFSAKS